MTITGTLTDNVTNKPIPGATFSLFLGGNTSAPPDGSWTSDANGNYTYVNASIDTASNPSVSVVANGYNTLYADPGFLQGPNVLYPLNTTTSTIPTWVWIVVAILGLISAFYLNKKYKLLK